MLINYIKIFIILCAIIPFSTCSESNGYNEDNIYKVEILSPRFVNPQFIKPGNQLVAEVRTAATSGEFTADLSNDLTSWPCTVSSSNVTMINNGRESGWLLTVDVPANIPPELFTLSVTHSSGNNDSEFGAISILQDPESDFYIMHTTDEQFSKLTNPPTGTESVQSVEWMGAVANIINPRVIVITGDQVEDGYTYTEKYEWYKNSKKNYTVPSLIAIGNNDCKGDLYEELQGQRAFSRKIGTNFFIIANDFNSDGYNLLPWVQNEYNVNWSSTGFELILQHWNSTGRAFSPPVGKPCDLMLLGHQHSNAVVKSSPYYALETIAASAHGGYSYAKSSVFYFHNNSGNWTCTSNLSDHASGVNMIQPFTDNGSGNVTVTYSSSNNGTQIANNATVTNKLNQNFFDGRIRFLMSGSGPFTVTGNEATKITEYNYGNNTKTAILVKVDIKPGNASVPYTTTISVEKE